jgi:hypothetical protein
MSRLTVHSRKMADMRPGVWLSYTYGRSKALFRYLRSFFTAATGAKGNQFAVDPSTLAIDAGSGSRLEEILGRIWQASRTAASRYVPKPIRGNAVIIRASQQDYTLYEDQYLGWKPVVQGSIECYEIDGNHVSIFNEPAVQVLAEKIDAKLRESSSAVPPEPPDAQGSESQLLVYHNLNNPPPPLFPSNRKK